jgi:hypothetical protein
MKTRSFTLAAAALTMLAASAGAHAADTVATRMAQASGRWIVAQGNQALAKLQDELVESLKSRLQPLLPESAELDADAATLQKVSTQQTVPVQQSL